MPSTSKSQYRFWRMCANNPEFAESRGISKETAKEWHDADKKKKKEDPEWYENLPDKVEKGKSGHEHEIDPEESFEGFGDILKRILGFPTPEERAAAERMVAGFKQDSSKLTQDMLKTGPIPISEASKLMQLHHWPNHRWIDDVASNAKRFGRYASDFSKLRARLSQELNKVYQTAQKMATFDEALNYVKSETNHFYLDYLEHFHALDDYSWSNFTQKINHGKGKILEPQKQLWGSVPPSIKAPNIDEARKIVNSMALISGMVESILDIQEREWCLDDTDDYRWWTHKYPDVDDHRVAALLNHFPIAGEWGHGLDIDVVEILVGMEKGLAMVLLHSLTKKSVANSSVSTEAKVPRAFNW